MEGCNRKQYAGSNVVLPGIRRVISASDTVLTPHIANVPISLANTEVSFSFPLGTKRFNLKARGGATLKLAYSVGMSGTDFLTIPAGCNYFEESIDPTAAITVYFQTTSANSLLELVYWS